MRRVVTFETEDFVLEARPDADPKVLAEALRGEDGVPPLMVAHYDGFELYRGLADVGGVRFALALAMYRDAVRARQVQAKRAERRRARRPVAVRAAA
ncbi:peptidoglycan-binding LysM (plasmid) [Oceanithermus profundus DSM 14977]|uniref:Peptidoglycan-binding LysM n=1 Tax=Oceanithermus profundus (strain DSM 14977 / NBRC 100410 / VKM B-2274 / 506) TaxID=670487 RepID=E4UAK0_OCEP5|nr:hypothetical protein [Oceanithermus profundus]ADR37779.1 peptidoglycan-binding LysM [Oceanithermus profundus DSM 14977]